jgi:chemotaxis protein MotC
LNALAFLVLNGGDPASAIDWIKANHGRIDPLVAASKAPTAGTNDSQSGKHQDEKHATGNTAATMPGGTLAFVDSAIAFAEGRNAAALAGLSKAIAQGLPVDLAAQAELTRGVLLSNADPARARKAFAAARLAAPGTLIEESALRRETLLSADDPVRFTGLASAYLRRFGQSPFASAFIAQMAFRITEAPLEGQDKIADMLDELLVPARAGDRQVFFAILARASLVGGNPELARMAATRAIRDTNDPSLLLSARLYKAALDIAGPDHQAAATELKSLMRAPLQPADQEILQAAISIARDLRRWPHDDAGRASALLVQGDAVPERKGPPAPGPAFEAANEKPSATIDAARAALITTEALGNE